MFVLRLMKNSVVSWGMGQLE